MDQEFTPSRVTAEQVSKSNPFIIPAAIIIGFALVAVALFFSRGGTGNPTNQGHLSGLSATASSSTIPAVTASDHILGNPNAPIMIVEYSDFDCPYCKAFHAVMHQVIDNYGPSGKVAWVFRNLPIQQLHPDAPALALDGECVAKIGGNDAFWKFADTVFNSRDATALTDMAQVPSYAEQAGVASTTFANCVHNGSLQSVVTREFNDAIAAGAQGTPFTVIEVGGKEIVLNGTKTYATMQQILDNLIAQIDGNVPPTASSTASSTGQ